MDRDVIEIQLTPEERSLLLRHGYPFEQIERALKACESSREIEAIPMDLFELERLIGDLSISINDMRGGALQDKLFDLCDRLGLFVWVEFPLSSSGHENLPPDEPAAVERFAEIATHYVKRLRHHPCVLVFVNQLYHILADS